MATFNPSAMGPFAPTRLTGVPTNPGVIPMGPYDGSTGMAVASAPPSVAPMFSATAIAKLDAQLKKEQKQAAELAKKAAAEKAKADAIKAKADAEAKKKTDAEAKKKADAEAKAKAEEEAKKKAEADKAKKDAEAKAKADAAKSKADAAQAKKDADAKAKADAAKAKADAAAADAAKLQKNLESQYRVKFTQLESDYADGKDLIEKLYTDFIANNPTFGKREIENAYNAAVAAGKKAKAQGDKQRKEEKNTLKQNSISENVKNQMDENSKTIDSLSEQVKNLNTGLDSIRNMFSGNTDGTDTGSNTAGGSTTTGDKPEKKTPSEASDKSTTDTQKTDYTPLLMVAGLGAAAFFILKRKH